MLPVTLLTGVDEQSRDAVAGELLAIAGSAVLVEYDLTALAGGSVMRIARTAAGVIDHEVIRMAHPCVSCAMRGSLVPLLVRIAAAEKYSAAIVSVPGAGDTQALAEEILRDARDELRVDAVLTVLESATFAMDVSGEDLIHDRGIPTAAEDGRAIAEVLVRQVEYANAVILSGPDDSAGEEAARALAGALNPQSLIRTTATAPELFGVRLHDPDAAEARIDQCSVADQRTGADSRLAVGPALPSRAAVRRTGGPGHRVGQGQGNDLARVAAALATRLGQLRHEHRPRRSRSVARRPPGGALVRGRPDPPGPVGAGVAPRARRPRVVPVDHRTGLDSWELERLLDGCVLRAGESDSNLIDLFAPYLEGSTAA